MESPVGTRFPWPLITGLGVGLVAGFGLGFVAAFAPILTQPDPPAAEEGGPMVTPVRGAIVGRGPHDGYVLVLEPGHLHLEILHNEHWGVVGAYPLSPDGEPVELARAPVLNVFMDEESYVVEATREDFDGNVDGGWHYEHDGLLGLPESARFNIRWNGRTYTPPCRHIHLNDGEGHGPGHAHAAAVEDDADPEE